MAKRISSIVTFTRPFRLGAMKHQLPAGSYTIDSDDERQHSAATTLDGRLGTFIRLPLPPGAAGASSRILVDPAELAAALARDVASEPYGPETGPETVAEHAARDASEL